MPVVGVFPIAQLYTIPTMTTRPTLTNQILNLLCCCGAFEDLFLANDDVDDLDDGETSDAESDLARPLLQ